MQTRSSQYVTNWSGFVANFTGTVSPFRFTFFDFNIGADSNLMLSTSLGFNGFVPFNRGGWYAGIGLGTFGEFDYPLYTIGFKIQTGVILFEWLRIGAQLQLNSEVVSGEFGPSFESSIGYVRWLRTRVR
jgi:hypothetical protein